MMKGTRMISFLIKNKGAFMSGLLSSGMFDSFLLEEATIQMAATLNLDGHLNRDFFSKEVWDDPQKRPYEYATWSEMRGCCRDFIKGKTAPSAFRFVLHLKPEYIPRTLSSVADSTKEAVEALGISIRLDSAGIHLVTGIAMKAFVPDKNAEKVWDRTMQHFLSEKEVDYEIE